MKGLLFASFGTTHQPAREKQINAVFAHLCAALPGYRGAQSYTSGMVRRLLDKKGVHVPATTAALRQLAAEGVTEVLIQPGHLLPGEEYDKLCREAEECRGLFTQMALGAPLLASTADIQHVAEIMAAEYPCAAGRAVVLMGHGTHQFANAVYPALEYHCKAMGREDMFVGTVEAYPGIETVLRLLEGKGYGSVLLAPLMQVAGDHALNDMAGEDDNSWASLFKARGYRVECRLTGLGEMPAVQALYLAHARAALEAGS